MLTIPHSLYVRVGKKVRVASEILNANIKCHNLETNLANRFYLLCL